MHPDPLEGLHRTSRPAAAPQETGRYTSKEDRLTALQMAINASPRDVQHEQIVETAEAFLKFITEPTATN